ncbi:sel1 repeat family protein [Methylomonas koyamae]|uniref:Signal transduction histidine kinase dimerisation/phosphoacceptor domain-containing protein n=1 Tax=Methylomonas koyamae TaxID=702114 RepID=A0A291IGW5_9GAMM|nr:sel1 repeat family protein [Methylomonas koyamae]ATG89421.1 hypothetical protein MKLM6_1164 [Methylomonas koyamae]OAI29890.1 hypothetical protein A1356_03700 [Methylomonas koyamae]
MKNSQEKFNKNTSSESINVFGIDLDKFKKELEDGSLEYELAIKELLGNESDYESGMEHIIKSAKKGNQDALNWLVNAGVRIVIPEVLWDKKNIQNCMNYVLRFCREHDAGPHAAMARFFRGLMCLSGQGVAKNEELAIHFLKQAAEGPFLDELGNDIDISSEHNGRDLINIYLDVLSENVTTDNNDGEYWNLKDLGKLLCNGLNLYWPFLYIDKYFILSLRLNVFLQSQEYSLAEEYLESVLKNIRDYEKILYEPFREVLFQQVKLEKANQELKAKESELEETMAMFAHKFRSPLDAIIYNTEHEHQEKLYRQAAQTMRGLLDIFSLVATDADKLQDRLKQDCRGNGNLISAFGKVLDMVLLHLLSASAKGLIRQHYLRYAKAQGLCDKETSSKQWYEDCRELEQKLQQDWEQSYAQLLSQSATLAQRLAWLESRFFKLELLGFERDDIQFDEYGITESLLTIVLNEFLVNVFKYYASSEKESVVLEWVSRDGHQVLTCRNPSTRHERTRIKGSGKGHVFLSALARKIGREFIKPNPADDFVVEFSLADELLISN